jgi:hypothetical protein
VVYHRVGKRGAEHDRLVRATFSAKATTASSSSAYSIEFVLSSRTRVRVRWDDSGGFRSHRPGTHLSTGKSKRLCQALGACAFALALALALGVLRGT